MDALVDLPAQLARGFAQAGKGAFGINTPQRHDKSRRMAQIDWVSFVLLWQAGLRVGELEELTLGDIDLKERKLVVRQGKELKDRVVYLTPTAVAAIESYLETRGPTGYDHLLIYRHRPVGRNFVYYRLRAVGVNEIVVPENEAGLEIVRHSLLRFDIRLADAEREVETLRVEAQSDEQQLL